MAGEGAAALAPTGLLPTIADDGRPAGDLTGWPIVRRKEKEKRKNNNFKNLKKLSKN